MPFQYESAACSYSRRKNKGESDQSSYIYICDLVEFTGWSTPHINPTPCCFSSTWGYQMCQAQFGMGQIQINILFQRATGDSPWWVSKKNTLGFICIVPSALIMLYVLALDPNSHLWLRWYNTSRLVSPSWKGMKLEFWQVKMQITSHTKCMQYLLSTSNH